MQDVSREPMLFQLPVQVAEFQTDVTMETDEDLEAQLEEFLEQNPEQVAEVKHKAMKDKAHAVSLNTETACDPKDVEDADTDPKDVEDADTEPPGKERLQSQQHIVKSP